MRSKSNLYTSHQSEVQSIFFHELGHYISIKLNSTNIKNFGIKSMKIFYCKECFKKIGGSTEPEIPSSFDNTLKCDNYSVAKKLTNLYFGCVFQNILFEKELSFKNCLIHYGNYDNEEIKNLLQNCNMLKSKHEIDNLYEDLKNEFEKRTDILSLKKIDISKIIEFNSQSEIKIDLNKLDELTSEFILRFKDFYNQKINLISQELY